MASDQAALDFYKGLGVSDNLLGFFAAADWEKTAQDVKVSPDFFSAPQPPVDYARALTNKYGRSWLEWEPETIWATISADFNYEPSEIVQNKIMAVKSVFLSDSFWKDWHVFEKTVLAFNDIIPMFDRPEPPTPAQIANGIEEAEKMRREDFSDEVSRYIAIICRDEGLIWLPPPLDVAQSYLDVLNSGKIGITLKDDIANRWREDKIKSVKEIKFSDDAVGNQLVRLVAIREYVNS